MAIEHLMTSHQPFLWLAIGYKGKHFFWND